MTVHNNLQDDMENNIVEKKLQMYYCVGWISSHFNIWISSHFNIVFFSVEMLSSFYTEGNFSYPFTPPIKKTR